MSSRRCRRRRPAGQPGDQRSSGTRPREGRLLLKRCLDCGSVIWYPRALCPDCGSLRTEWFEAGGPRHGLQLHGQPPRPGRLPRRGPYVLAYVELDEGPRMMTNIVGADAGGVAVGLPVEVVFHDTGEGTALPRFRPAAELAQGRADTAS